MHSELCINSPEARRGRLAKQAGRLVVLESLSALRFWGGGRGRLEDETRGIISALGEP